MAGRLSDAAERSPSEDRAEGVHRLGEDRSRVGGRRCRGLGQGERAPRGEQRDEERGQRGGRPASRPGRAAWWARAQLPIGK